MKGKASRLPMATKYGIRHIIMAYGKISGTIIYISIGHNLTCSF